jgi:hypothetical protein
VLAEYSVDDPGGRLTAPWLRRRPEARPSRSSATQNWYLAPKSKYTESTAAGAARCAVSRCSSRTFGLVGVLLTI